MGGANLPLGVLAFLALRTDMAVAHTLPVLNDIPQHLFPEFQKIRGDDAAPPVTPPWYGGDIAAHVDSIRAMAGQWFVKPGAVGSVIDIEHRRLPLDGSRACRAWIAATLDAWREATGALVAMYDCDLFPELQDFFVPCAYAFGVVKDNPGPTGEVSPGRWAKMTAARIQLAIAAAGGKPVAPAIELRYWNNPVGGVVPWVPSAAVELFAATAIGLTGRAAVWDMQSSQAECTRVSAELATIKGYA